MTNIANLEIHVVALALSSTHAHPTDLHLVTRLRSLTWTDRDEQNGSGTGGIPPLVIGICAELAFCVWSWAAAQ
jgi:hypothetical protein